MRDIFKACLLSLLMLVILACPLAAQAENIPQPALWDRGYPFSDPIRLDNVTILYNTEKPLDKPALVHSVQSSFDSVDWCFGDYLTFSSIQNGYTSDSYIYRTTVEIAGDTNEFRLLTGLGTVPDDLDAMSWNEGINGLVVIKSPEMLPDFEQVLTYHLARVAERTMMTKYRSMPEWYLDGTASYISGNITDEHSNAMLVAALGRWKSLDELEAVCRNRTIDNAMEPEYVDARAQSAMLASHIAQTYGNKNLIGILKDYTDNGNLTLAFINRTAGHDPESINTNLRDSLTGNVSSTSPAEKARVDGYLKYADGQPARGLTISFARTYKPVEVMTSPAGRYSASLDPGTYKISVPGQTVTGSETITLKAGETLQRDITIAAPVNNSATPLSAMTPRDLVIPAVIIAGNLLALIGLIAILRRNWH